MGLTVVKVVKTVVKTMVKFVVEFVPLVVRLAGDVLFRLQQLLVYKSSRTLSMILRIRKMLSFAMWVNLKAVG